MSVTNFCHTYISECKTSKAAWKVLSDLYKAKTAIRRRALRRELQDLRMLPSESLTQYIERSKLLWIESTSAGCNIQKNAFCDMVINALPKESARTLLPSRCLRQS
jgi:hypothetical protein